MVPCVSKVLEKNFTKCRKLFGIESTEKQEVSFCELATLSKSVHKRKNVNKGSSVSWLIMMPIIQALNEYIIDKQIVREVSGMVLEDSKEEVDKI